MSELRCERQGVLEDCIIQLTVSMSHVMLPELTQFMLEHVIPEIMLRPGSIPIAVY